jgi:polysaccharide export outer membrane protein
MRFATALLSRGIAFLLGAAVPIVMAQSVTPSAQQMEMLRTMTPEQQQAILQQVGAASGAAGTTTASGAAAASAAGAQGTDLERAENLRRRLAPDEKPEPLFPILKPDDTVVLQVEIRPRRTAASSAAAALAAQAQAQAQVSGTTPPATPPIAPQSGQSTLQNGQPVDDSLDEARLTTEETRQLKELVDLIRSRNPYRLDASGVLTLPGFAGISLGGLTEGQANMRLAAEPALLKLDFKLIRLPLAKVGLQGLKRFGYDLFDDAPSTFSPVNDVPVPADYVMGPGDQLNVQLYGNLTRTYRLSVGRDGRVAFPDLGPISVSGQRFSAAKSNIEARVARQMIGTQADVSIADLRSIRVFVLGEARRPGSYTVSGLSTITSALFASGGVKPIGSLRDIQLKRQGTVVRHMDLYDLLIRGDTQADVPLLPGDAIFIPPVGATVSVEGEVQRPAIYELRGENTVGDLVQMAGGLTPEADAARASLTQISPQSRREVFEMNVGASAGKGRALRNGDVLRVARLRPTLDSGVMLQGAVYRPGPFAWHEGLRLTEVIGSIDELRPNADQGYVLIRRELPPDRRVAVLSSDLAAALAAPGSPADTQLMPRDQITVFDFEPGRERVIKPIMDELRLQSALEHPTEVVRVEGQVKVPGEYPLEPGMTVRDLLRAGGNLQTGAYGGKAEIARYRVVDGDTRRTELIDIDLAAVRRGDPAADIVLQPFDYLLIKETPDWNSQESVKLVGEVRFPGTYPIRRGETLHQLLIRAGGLSPLAFPRGSAFTRKELKEREQKQLDMLGARLQNDVASLSLQAAAANQTGASQSLAAGQYLLTQLRQSQAVGRLVIDLPGLMGGNEGSEKDVILKDGDELVVPKQRQEVTVIGEVQSVTSHLYRKELSRDDYIALSGGMTRKADGRKIYVVRTDGSVVANERSLFRRHFDVAIMPGDTIVVPLDAERMPRLPFWQAVTSIIYNLAVSVAAINSF